MDAIILTGNAPYKAEIKYNGKFGHTLGRIQHIPLMSRIGIFNATYRLATHTLVYNLPGFQAIKSCVKYLASLILIMDQMSLGLNGVGIKLKNTL